MIGSGFATSVGMLIACYGLGVGLGVGMVYGTVVSNAVKFFPDKSGLAGGLTTACYGGSSVLMPAIVTLLLNRYSITAVFKIVGAVMTLIICASAFVIQSCPPDFKVEGTAAADAQKPSKDYRWSEMLREPVFYLMLLTLTCGAFAGMMIISQASPIAQRMMGFTPVAAAAVVSVLALFNMLGRLVSGTLSDKIGSANTLRITFACSLLASVLLYFCQQGRVALFYIGLAVIGFCFGGIMGIYPGFTARQFGRRNNSVNYGIMFIGFALAGLIGPMIMNAVVNATGRYQPAFLACAALAAVGEVLIALFARNGAEG
jgi:MFS family permease